MTFQDSTTQQQPPAVVDTGNGFLVGVDPAQPRQAGEWTGQQPPQQQQPPPQQQGERLFTAEEVEAFRQQEKDKLYGRLDEMGTQLKSVLEEREAERAEKTRLAEEAAAAQAAKEESEMDLRALIEKRDAEWQERFTAMEQQSAAERAIFEQERRLNELIEYRRARVEQEAEFILPDLRDFVSGSTAEEIDQSIEVLKQRSEVIASNFAAAAAQQQQPFRGGAMPSVPPVGPLEQLPSYESLSPQVIAEMDMDTYKRHRPQLLQAASQHQRRQGR
jgi:hypothetical protein